MKLLTWGYSKARIWLDELPDWKYELLEVMEYDREVGGKKEAETRYVAIELFIPIGARTHYGGLGAILVPEFSGKLRVQVGVSSQHKGQLYEDTLAGKMDTVYKGLPVEYLQGILDGVMQFKDSQALKPGTLSFSHAVHGEVSSSIRVFQLLSQVVIKILNLDMQSQSEDDLKELIKLEVTQRLFTDRFGNI